MTITLELILECPRDEVWRAFDSTENLHKWMKSLKSFEHLSGEPGQPGARSKVIFEENGRIIENIETITVRNKPGEFVGTYDNDYGQNLITQRFEVLGDSRTRWTGVTEMRLKGFMKIMAWLMKGMIRKKILKDMNCFKEKLEAGELN
ncbi:MAG: SRPBCC family protein [Planctomycetota bacterium]|nr:SRPBCC family protein [Planctomycetota bacterium]